MKYMIIALALLLAVGKSVQAQTVEQNTAHAGGGAVFIYHAFPAASPQFPDKGFTGVKLEREDVSAPGKWVTISNTNTPQNVAELLRNYQRASALFPGAKELDFNAEAAWAKYERYKLLDSLADQLAYTPVQMAFNLLLADTAVQKGKTYRYRVSQVGATAGGSFITNNVAYPAIIKAKKPKTLRRITEPKAIRIEWYTNNEPATAKFKVYRRSDAEKKYTEIMPYTYVEAKGDTLKYSIRDESVLYSTMYHYYITPVNDFGGGGNIVSDTVSATCMEVKDLLTPLYFIAKGDSAGKSIVLKYKLKLPQYIGTVAIMRSAAYDTGYEEIGINNGSDTVFTDRRIEPGVKYYYYLVMADKLGRKGIRSVKTFGLYQSPDNDQPARFVNAETKGKAILVTWKKPQGEKLSGFYVYRCEGVGSPFKRLTVLLPETDSTYTDNYSFKPGVMYGYAVRSENLSNKESKNSNIAYVTSGTVDSALIAPKNFEAQAQGNGIRLTWYDMRALNSGIGNYRITRKADTDAQEVVLNENYPSVFATFLDSTALAGKTYIYNIQSLGSSSRSVASTSNSVTLRAIKLAAPGNLVAYASTKGTNLSWSRLFDERVKYFVIYRYARGQQPQAIATVPANTRSYADATASKETTFYYFLRSAGADKVAASGNSNEAFVK